MKSDFTHGIDSLKRINGNIQDDYDVAKTAVSEIEEFITDKLSVIDEYSDLKRILTSESPAEIGSILISVRHVMSSLSEIQVFHSRGQLNNIFDISKHKMSKLVESSESKAKKLIDSIQC
jgi:hypothetical protein